jgi:hypothetical protein
MKAERFAILAAALLAVSPVAIEAKGCIKGALVGGVAGHYAGHHAIAGAAVGCVTGHYMAKRQARQPPLRSPPPHRWWQRSRTAG